MVRKLTGILLLFIFCTSMPAESNLSNQTNSIIKPAHKEKDKMKIIEHKSGSWTPNLSEEEKNTLFSIAQDTLIWCVEKEQSGKFDFSKYNITQKLKEKMATFVTLKIGGELRGCIGTLVPEEELYLSVHRNAIRAALEDFRFNPVQPNELKNITISVSILSPLRHIKGLEEFKIGEHGIILSKAGRRAVFLPEVATEQGWDVATTLTHLSLKAGLPADAWKHGASFMVFESVVLSTEEL